jgi:hypothetical protein
MCILHNNNIQTLNRWIQWENRLRGDIGNRALVCVDGIHIKIYEPSPFCKDWNSHKLGGSAVAYELVTCIATGDIVAYNGPFPAGKWNDIKIFRNKTKLKLGPYEKVLGDLGYKGDIKVLTKLDAHDRQHSYAMGCARDRHETINRRIRTWGALNKPFRHSRHDHHLFFRSAIVMEQIKFENGSPPFQVRNYIDPVRLLE